MDNTAKKTVETTAKEEAKGFSMSDALGYAKKAAVVAGTIGGLWYLVDKGIDFLGKDADEEK